MRRFAPNPNETLIREHVHVFEFDVGFPAKVLGLFCPPIAARYRHQADDSLERFDASGGVGERDVRVDEDERCPPAANAHGLRFSADCHEPRDRQPFFRVLARDGTTAKLSGANANSNTNAADSHAVTNAARSRIVGGTRVGRNANWQHGELSKGVDMEGRVEGINHYVHVAWEIEACESSRSRPRAIANYHYGVAKPFGRTTDTKETGDEYVRAQCA